MKIAIVGSRDFKDKDKVFYELQRLHELVDYHSEVSFVSGGARGVDTWAEENAKILKFPIKVIKPDWNKYGKRAGFLRNELIVNKADKLIAFWNGTSKGTKHSIDLAIKKGISVDIYIRS